MKGQVLQTDQNNPQVKAYCEAIARGLQNYHVVFHDNSWVVTKPEADEPEKICPTQKQAVEFASQLAKKQKRTVFVHKRNGRLKTRLDFA